MLGEELNEGNSSREPRLHTATSLSLTNFMDSILLEVVCT